MTTPGYRQIADDLRAAIAQKDFPPGTTIPLEADLQARYGVSRLTVRRAVALLRAEGLVVTRRRQGTLVRNRTPVRLSFTRHAGVLTAPSNRGPWEQACDEQGLSGRADIVSVDRLPVSGTLADLLAVPEGTTAIRRLQHMYAADQVAQIQQTWLPLAVAEGTPLAAPDLVIGGIYRALVAGGYRPISAEEYVKSRMPTSDEAAVLNLELGSPVLAIERVTRDNAGGVLVVAQYVADGDRVQLHYTERLPEEPSQ